MKLLGLFMHFTVYMIVRESQNILRGRGVGRPFFAWELSTPFDNFCCKSLIIKGKSPVSTRKKLLIFMVYLLYFKIIRV